MAKKLPKILVVNDSVADSRTIISILIGNNYDPIACKEAMNGLFLLDENQFDLIILRPNFKDMGVSEIFMILKENESTTHIPVILIATNEEKKEVENSAPFFKIAESFEPQFNGLKLVRAIDNILKDKRK